MVGEKFQSIFNIILNEVIYFFFWGARFKEKFKTVFPPSPHTTYCAFVSYIQIISIDQF